MKKQAWLTSISHFVLKNTCALTDRKFRGNRNNLEKLQRQRLDAILKSSILAEQYQVKDYAAFCKQFPVTRYANWRDFVLDWREGGSALSESKLVRFQPTSGSSEQIKFIPYTKAFLDELDQAIAPWLSSLYRAAPKLAEGKHYWSVSWLPESQRDVLKGDNLNDDSALLSLSKRLLSQFTQAVPQHVSFAAHPEDALFATLCYLVATEDLAMISVWSPTFALQLFERLNIDAQEMVQVLSTGSWAGRTESLKGVDAPYAPDRARVLQQLAEQDGEIDLEKLWTGLCLISSWDTAGSKQWAKVLHQQIPHAVFEGKGLWATEGVVTIPYDGRYPLAYLSHFYEFEYLEGERQGQVIPSWELKKDDHVSPVITSGNGLLRYCLDDHLIVTDFFGQVPCFEFQGRRFGVDLVGEKFAPEAAQQILSKIEQQHCKPISLLAIDTEQQEKPFYCLLVEGDASVNLDVDWIDQQLRQHFHYELARDLGQLAVPRILYADNGWDAYKQLVMREGMIEGNIKPEPLKKVTLTSLEQLQ